MRIRFVIPVAGVLACAALLSMCGSSAAAVWTTNSETVFKQHAGTVAMESFETIPIDSWIYHTRLPALLPALDLDDDPTDPNDGPNYDLDGHFTITGNNVAYAPSDELFIIFDGAPATDEVDGGQYLRFSPWYNILWPTTFDSSNQHPIVTFDNFNNSGDSVNAFGFYLYNYTPSEKWIVMEYGDEFVPVNLSGDTGNYFIGVISDTPFDHVQLHTNQNGGGIMIDELYFSSDGQVPTNGVPEPASIVLWSGLGVLGMMAARRRRQGR